MKSTAWLTVVALGSWAAAAPASAQIVYSFQGSPNDGTNPFGGLISDSTRALFGTTYTGGNGQGTNGFSFGTVYRLTPPLSPSGHWMETVLHNFPASSGDGDLPNGDLLMGADGTLYGTTETGGAGSGGTGADGTVYSLVKSKGDTWTETVLHSFTLAEGDYVNGGVTAGPGGALYGVAGFGGPLDNDEGVVYQLSPPAAGQTQWNEQTLHSFSSSTGDGAYPFGSLLRDKAGNLYGTTQNGGGRCNCGVVYQLSPPAPGQTEWTETIVHSFAGGFSGAPTHSGLVMDARGVLYGTTSGGGEVHSACRGCGLVFRLAPPATPGTPWTYTPIFLFNGTDGGLPDARLTLSANGNLYGTTEFGGDFPAACKGGCGTVFKLTHPGKGMSNWTETYVAVPGRYAGRELQADILIGSDHALYTTSSEGGFKGGGSVLRVTPDMLQGVGSEP